MRLIFSHGLSRLLVMPATKIFSHFIWRCAGVRSLQILTMMMDDEWDEDWTEDVISCLTASEDLQNMSTISVTSGDKESDRHGEVTVDAGEAISNGTSNGSDDSGDFTVEAGAAGAVSDDFGDGIINKDDENDDADDDRGREGDDLAAALSASKREETLRQLATRIHNERLEKRLLVDGMQRERVYADGNCFFKSAALHIRSQDDTALRQSLCNHIAENIHSYWGFFPNCSSPDEALQQIIAIRGSGIWDTAVNDVLPLALANFTGRRIKIFTSKQDPDVINVKLTMCNGDVFQPIYLAYLAPSGLPEHYDGCIAKKRHLYTLFGTTQHVVEESECHESSSGTFSFHSSGTTQINVLVEEQPQPDVRPEDNERNTPPHHSTSSSMQGHAEMSTCQTPPHPDNCTSEETTPRPVYETPPKKAARKRAANPSKWKKNTRKTAKLRGQEYVNSRGKVTAAKQVHQIDCSKCGFKCNDNITFEQQQTLFSTFYGLENYERQKDFICRSVQEKATVTLFDEKTQQPVKKKRQVTRRFFFTIDGQPIQVCKRFFLGTLCLGHAFIQHALDNCRDGVFCGEDRRGRHTPINKTKEEDRMRAKQHIESFPALESHYGRSNTQKKYLDSTLNINRMYRMYTEACQKDGVCPVSSSMYRDIFCKEFNLSFHSQRRTNVSCVQDTTTQPEAAVSQPVWKKSTRSTKKESGKEERKKQMTRKCHRKTMGCTVPPLI